jgi:hypothetical protein
MMMPRLTDEQILAWINPVWFWSKVQQGTPDCCWLWTGPTASLGYGQITITTKGRHRRTGAHRVAYLLGTGKSLGPLDALHRCDNPPCCNYEQHLFAGTQADNNQDKISKGRWRGPTKLTTTQVAEIKRRWH